jgi:UDP-N-acetylmuramoyl-L-alanyl-D-glutamate--2,6-diaminopimelate ligase
MQLATLIEGLSVTAAQGPLDRPIGDVADDSRQVEPGALFVARAGYEADGSAFIADAIERGAAAVLTERMTPPAALADHPQVTWLTAERVDQALCGELGERLFDRPSEKLRLVGVTGTNGKTTTAFVIQHLLKTADISAGLLGTILVDDGASREEATLTTPGAIDFSRLLARMVANGCRAAVCEVSSHALEQGRTAALRFDVGVFTNLTGDHLDYHGSMAAYAAAKAKLFTQLPSEGWAIVNHEDPHAERMVRDARCRVMWTTLHEGGASAASEADDAADGDARAPDQAPFGQATIARLAADHTQARFEGPWGSFNLRLPLVGRHNVANALQATAAANMLVSLSRRLKRGLESCPNVPGRLEVVTATWSAEGVHQSAAQEQSPQNASAGQTTGPSVLVDYAHTHDALENVLLALGPVTRGELVVVFGCGGDRDASKRPKMAEVAGRLAGRLYITSDNPRTEDPDAIIRDILAGVPIAKRDRTTVEPDRARAIALAIQNAGAADTVLIAGKGHEDYQIVGQEKRHFDDREQAAGVLRQAARGNPSPLR